jgi:hypothetical protein
MYGLKIASEMTRAFPLADRAFVVDFPNSFYQVVIECDFPDSHTFLLSLSETSARSKADLLPIPFIERGDRENGEVVPFHEVGILWLRLGQALREGKQIDSGTGPADAFKDRLWVGERLVFFSLQTGDPY